MVAYTTLSKISCHGSNHNIFYLIQDITFFILETCKKILWQTVKTHMKCCIRQHFVRICTVCLDKTIFRNRIHHFIDYLTDNPHHFIDILTDNPHHFIDILTDNPHHFIDILTDNPHHFIDILTDNPHHFIDILTDNPHHFIDILTGNLHHFIDILSDNPHHFIDILTGNPLKYKLDNSILNESLCMG